MDRIENYKDILIEELTRRASFINPDKPDLKNHLIVNEDASEFILIKFGWVEYDYVHYVIFHFEIKNNKIWLHQNNTDVEIGKILVEKGIPKSNIVIGFLAEYERATEGYALA